MPRGGGSALWNSGRIIFLSKDRQNEGHRRGSPPLHECKERVQ